LTDALAALASLFVLVATVPVLAGAYQFLALGLSMLKTNLERVQPHLPRVAILIPAWNEGAVVGTTIDRLMALDYPRDRLRIYVVDDASSDETPHIATP
jgi:cellulose synthase/poly-beta-1,6-N-acetylglucosamine synthase-like glycosyltransferase